MKKRFIVIAALLIGYAITHVSFVHKLDNAMHQIASCVAYPLLRVQYALAYIPSKMISTAQLMRINKESYQALEQKYYALLSDHIEKADQLQLYKQLEGLLRDQPLGYEKSVLAQIIEKNMTHHGHYYIVNVGSVKGIKENMVAVYKNCLVGKVVHVTPFYSKIALITDRHCKIAARCDQSQAQGLYEGLCQQTGALHHISHLQPIYDNELVVTSGQGTVFPRGLGIGTIKNHVVQGVTHTIEVTPLLNLHDLSYCYVVQKGDTPVE